MFKSQLNLKLFSFFWARWISGFCCLFCRINCTLQFVLFVGQILAAPWKLMIQQLISLLSLLHDQQCEDALKVCICLANLVIQFVNWVWPIVYNQICNCIIFIKQLQTSRALYQIMEKSWQHNFSIFGDYLKINEEEKKIVDHHWPILQIRNFREHLQRKKKTLYREPKKSKLMNELSIKLWRKNTTAWLPLKFETKWENKYLLTKTDLFTRS